jgi:hypothetical protein
MRTAVARPTAPLLLIGALIVPATALVTPAAAAPRHASAAAPGAYQPLNPTRVFDTRTASPIGSGATVRMAVQGVAGLPTSGLSAVTVTLSVLAPAAAGSISVFPSGTSWSGAATVSFAAASTQQNTVTAQLGSDGALSVRNNAAAAVQLVADAVGYYTAGPAMPGGYQPVPLQRIFDTRAAGSQPLASGDMVNVPVTGQGAIPASNVSAGAVNLTVLNPAGTGSISVFPSGTAWDTSATVSFTAGRTEQSMLTAQLGTDGAFTVRNNTGTAVQLVIDLAGYYIAGSPPAPGGYVPMTSRIRVFDSRRNMGPYTGPFTAGQLQTAPTLRSNFPDPSTKTPDWGLRAETILLTVVSPSQSGSISVFAGDQTFDGKATISFTAGRTVQRLVTVRIPPEGTIGIRNNSSVTLSVIADVKGYFAGVQNRLHVAAEMRLASIGLSELADVSCTSASFCIAVTYSERAFRYDGSSWSDPMPAGPNAVSCVSPTFCMGVGLGVVWIYDGTQWTKPVGGAPDPGSVSCASPTFCVVVSVSGGWVSRYNGTGLDDGTIINPQAHTSSAVSCPTSTFCMAWADGWYQWNGSHWSGVAGVAGVAGLDRVSVSCVSSTFCQYAAIGSSAVWNGTSWQSARAPTNRNTTNVSCPAAFACIVSDEAELSGWDGTEWSMPITHVHAPNYPHSSCPTVNFCMVMDAENTYQLES